MRLSFFISKISGKNFLTMPTFQDRKFSWKNFFAMPTLEGEIPKWIFPFFMGGSPLKYCTLIFAV